jgi:hypothetical protein
MSGRERSDLRRTNRLLLVVVMEWSVRRRIVARVMRYLSEGSGDCRGMVIVVPFQLLSSLEEVRQRQCKWRKVQSSWLLWFVGHSRFPVR